MAITRTAVVTGGGSGIGRAIAIQLAEDGYQVLIVGRDEARLRAVCVLTAGVDMLVADLGDAGQRAAFIDAIAAARDGLDLLVNNAAVQRQAPIGDSPPAALEAEVQVNLIAPLVLSAGLLPLLRVRGGTIVNVTSILAAHPKTAAPMYCATKAGLRSATRSLREELRAAGVRVVELVPPLVDTAMTAGRNAGAIAPAEVARALIAGLRRSRPRIDVGRARAFGWIDRVAPGLAARMVRDA